MNKKMNNQWAVRMAAFFFVPVIALFAAGCGDNDDNGTGPDMGEGALLRVVHASPDAPGVDVYAEGVTTPLVSGLAYGQASAYLAIDPGTYNIQLRPAGASSGSAPVYQTGNLTLSDGDTITAVAVGLLAPGNAGQAFRVLALGEGFTNPGSGNAAVRIVHGSPDAPTVETDLLERPLKGSTAAMKGGVLSVTIPAFGIATVKVG